MARKLPIRAESLTEAELKRFLESCRKGRIADVRKALKAGADPNVLVTSWGSRPLTEAVRGGHIEVVKMLLENNADPNLKDTGLSELPGGTALEDACCQGRLDIAKLLVERGADLNKKGYWPPLRSAISHGRTEIVQFLLSAGAKLEPGWLAQAWGKVEVVRLLLAAGVDVNYQHPETRVTALHISAKLSDPASARVLLEGGAKVDVRSALGDTPLTIAAEKGNLEVVKLLLEAGADPAFPGPKGKTAEHWARVFKRKEVVQFLKNFTPQKVGQVFQVSLAKKPKKRGHGSAAPQKLQASQGFIIPDTSVSSTGQPCGASDFVDMAAEGGESAWITLAVEAPLEKTVAAYCKLFPVEKRIKPAKIKPAQKSDKILGEWNPFVRPSGANWTVIYRVVSFPVEGSECELAISDAKLLSKHLKTKALSFLGSHGAMECDLFERGKPLGSEDWEEQSSQADDFFRKLGLYLPACYAASKSNSAEPMAWLAVCPPSMGKVDAAHLLLPA